MVKSERENAFVAEYSMRFAKDCTQVISKFLITFSAVLVLNYLV